MRIKGESIKGIKYSMLIFYHGFIIDDNQMAFLKNALNITDGNSIKVNTLFMIFTNTIALRCDNENGK